MKNKITYCALLLLIPFLGNTQGFTVSGSELKDANGNTFIMKGINVPLAWYQNDVLANIKNIKKATNSNTLRIVVGAGITPIQGTGQNWNTPDATWQAAVDSCIKNKIIPMIEVHNILGSNDSLDLKAVTEWWVSKKDYLKRPDIAKYILINIANEWGDWKMSQATAAAPNQVYWRDSYITAVKRLRAAGITTTLVIDAPGYGQDKGATALLTHAPAIINADPLKNLMFSIHTYCEWNTPNGANATTVFPEIKKAGIAFFVGEVADQHPDGANTCQIPATQIMGASVQYNSGYLGWSWKGNGGGTEALDMSLDWAGTQLTPWGELSTNSIVGTKTASDASVFGGGSGNKMPTVTLTAPTNNASFQAPASFILEAAATDADGKIRRVEFYQGSVKAGEDTSAPYSLEIKELAKGTYSFTAFAVDNQNGSGISNSVSVLVTSANGNIITNGDFETNSAGWEFQITPPATGTMVQTLDLPLSGKGSLRICPGNPGTEDYHLQANTKASIVKGQTYELSFLAKTDTARTIKVGFQQNGGKWKWYTGLEFSLTNASQLYSYSFIADTTDPVMDIKFFAGISKSCIKIDNVIFSSSDITGIENAPEAKDGLLLYPNPFSKNLTIKSQGEFRYEIRNNSGQLVETGTGYDVANAGSSLPKGFYFLKVISSVKTSESKIIKE